LARVIYEVFLYERTATRKRPARHQLGSSLGVAFEYGKPVFLRRPT